MELSHDRGGGSMGNEQSSLDGSTEAGLPKRANMAPKHVMRIANAIYSNFLTERADDVFLIRSLDFLIIALEEPFAIQVTSSDMRRTFETCNTKGMICCRIPIWFPSGVALRVWCDGRQNEAGCAGLLEQASTLLVEIAKTLEDYAGSRVAELGHRMNKAINALAGKGAIDERRDSLGETSTENARLFDRFFERLDLETLSASDLCFFPNHIAGSNRCSRMFFFHRHTPSNTFSMSLHPLAAQQNSRGSKYLQMAAEGIWRFDDVVSKGLVSWIRWPWEGAERGVPTNIRAFKDYLTELTASREPRLGDEFEAIGDCKGLAVPLHVGGFAWLVVLVVFSGQEKDYGELAYYLSRAVVPTLFDRIAGVAREEYLQFLAERAKASFAGRFDAEALNLQMRQIAPFFPYNEWHLSSERTDLPITAFKETYYLNEVPIPQEMDPIVINFRRISPQLVRDKIQNTAREMENEIQQQRDSQQGADEGIGHTLKNIVDLTNWPTSLAQLRNLIRNYDRLVADGRRDEIRRRLYDASRCIGLFSLVGGLGHFARLAGALDREEYGKFNDWVDMDGLRRWTSGNREDERTICDAYVHTVHRIVASLCASLDMGRAPQKFEVVCAGASREWKRKQYDGADQDDHGHFDKFSLQIPPFKKGSDAAYSFIFALMEPLVNALRALEQLRVSPILGSSDPILRVCITSRLPEEVVFSITNPSATRVQGSLSGFEKTRHMLRRIEIAEIDDLQFIASRSGVYEAVANVHFKPYGLAMRIAQQAGGPSAPKSEVAANR
jgi:hypothetical protein